MTVQRIVMIRPGETMWNRLGRWQGWVASPLSDYGRQQAAALARFVRHIKLAALYTSDLTRALQTADMLAAELGFTPTPDARLRERSIGMWQGLTGDEIRAWYPDTYAALLQDGESYRVPGGESRADVRTRMLEGFAAILKDDKGETIGILSHTTALKLLLAEIVPGFDPIDDHIGNTSVTTILRDHNAWKIVAVNDVSHLDGLESKAFPEVDEKS
ncbi:MAG: histidine phosphatase family protein [Chloroflexota bacterium]|nr:histidine phosphatase family protein [Chloroflexota bacterium]